MLLNMLWQRLVKLAPPGVKAKEWLQERGARFELSGPAGAERVTLRGAAAEWVAGKASAKHCHHGRECTHKKCGFAHPADWPFHKPAAPRAAPPAAPPVQRQAGDGSATGEAENG